MLYGLLIFNPYYQLEYDNYNLVEFPFLFRGRIKDTIDILARELIKNTRQNFYKINDKFMDNEMSIYLLNHEKIYIAVTHVDYPQEIISKLFYSLINENTYSIQKDMLFSTYQLPQKIDKMAQLKNELDQTKIILCDSIDKLMQRGESLDDLVIKSQNISETSFLFSDKAKSMNRCCIII